MGCKMGAGHLIGSSLRFLGALLPWWRHLLVIWRIQAPTTEISVLPHLVSVSSRQETWAHEQWQEAHIATGIWGASIICSNSLKCTFNLHLEAIL